MSKLYTLFAAASLLTLSACSSFISDPFDLPRPKMIKEAQFSKTQRIKVDYQLFLPSDYSSKSGKTWPLILFLHGAAERGADLRKVALHGPSQYIAEHPDFPFIVVSPQCHDGQLWSNDVLLALLDEISGKYKVDKGRIYLTGLSMGGYGAWDLGLTNPEIFAAIVPVCGGGQMIALTLTSREKPQALKTLPVWAFHGAKDPVVPMEESQRMIDALKKIGNKDAKLTIYPDAGHNSWTKTYDNPQLYEWLLQHERTTSKAN